MTIADLLIGLLQAGLLLSWPVTIILVRGAVHRPRYLSLTLMATLSFLVSLGLTVYVWAVANATFGFPVAKELAQAIFRLVLLGLVAFQVIFLWAYLTGRFRDGGLQ